MNAGAYDGEIKEIVVEATAISSDGFLKTFRAEEMQFSYRQSIFQNNGYTILTARLKLNRGNRENIEQRMCELAYSRNKKQPLDKPSAGSTFRRPQGYFVGPMLEEMGLKGYRIGGAEVSPKHAGFIVNVGDATANDVLQLIAYIKEKAKEHFGVELQTEIKVVGE